MRMNEDVAQDIEHNRTIQSSCQQGQGRKYAETRIVHPLLCAHVRTTGVFLDLPSCQSDDLRYTPNQSSRCRLLCWADRVTLQRSADVLPRSIWTAIRSSWPQASADCVHQWGGGMHCSLRLQQDCRSDDHRSKLRRSVCWHGSDHLGAMVAEKTTISRQGPELSAGLPSPLASASSLAHYLEDLLAEPAKLYPGIVCWDLLRVTSISRLSTSVVGGVGLLLSRILPVVRGNIAEEVCVVPLISKPNQLQCRSWKSSNRPACSWSH